MIYNLFENIRSGILWGGLQDQEIYDDLKKIDLIRIRQHKLKKLNNIENEEDILIIDFNKIKGIDPSFIKECFNKFIIDRKNVDIKFINIEYDSIRYYLHEHLIKKL